MSKDEVDKWARETQSRAEDMVKKPASLTKKTLSCTLGFPNEELSRSCSCFEMLDPHDPVISRLATQLFKKTNDYLQGEMTVGQDYYTLLEQINRLAITKHADIRSLAVNLSKTLNEYNEMYNDLIKPLLLQIDQIDAKVSRLEASAYRLDSYTKQLKATFKELQEK